MNCGRRTSARTVSVAPDSPWSPRRPAHLAIACSRPAASGCEEPAADPSPETTSAPAPTEDPRLRHLGVHRQPGLSAHATSSPSGIPRRASRRIRARSGSTTSALPAASTSSTSRAWTGGSSIRRPSVRAWRSSTMTATAGWISTSPPAPRIPLGTAQTGPNRLYKNLGGGTFCDVTDSSGLGLPRVLPRDHRRRR